MTTSPPDDWQRVLVALIKSGSADGREDVRRWLRKNVSQLQAAPGLLAASLDFIAPYAEVTDARLRYAAAGNPGTVTVTIHPEIAAAVLRFRAAIPERKALKPPKPQVRHD